MSDVNTGCVTGRIGSFKTSENAERLSIRLACSAYVKEKEERTDWFTVVVWGPRATALSKIIEEGQQLSVQYVLRESRWETRDGQKRRSVELHAKELMLGARARERRQ